MRTLLLELSLGNDANDCFMISALLGELWACCMDNTFSWAWGTQHDVAVFGLASAHHAQQSF